MLAVFQHMQSKYGFVPSAIDLVNEPDTFSWWSPEKIGRCLVAARARLAAAGFNPEFIAASNVATGNVPGYFDQMITIPGALEGLTEISYHRYNTAGSLTDITSRAIPQGKRTSMTQWLTPDNNYRILYEDLTLGRVSAWEQGAFADSSGCKYNEVVTLTNGSAQLCPVTKLHPPVHEVCSRRRRAD